MSQQAFVTPVQDPAFAWQSQPADHTPQRLRQQLLQVPAAAVPMLAAVDRLETAFKALSNRGILARHDYSCCMTCGSAEIRDEIAAARRAGQSADGFVFYHWPDTDDAAQRAQLELSFGSRLGGPMGVAEIGVVVVQTLREAGLQVVWNGSATARIQVQLAA